MDSRNDKKRMKVEDDRLSNLPDDLIHKILSFIDTKHVVQTSVMSSRWRFIWTSMPYLSFSTEDIPTCPKYNEFVTHVLSCRSNLVDVISINLRYCGKLSKVCFKNIMKYAVSHNIQQLNIVCVLDKKVEFPISLLSFRTLKHLSLKKEPNEKFLYKCPDLCFVTMMSNWELPVLTSLYLDNFTLCCVDDTEKGNSLFFKCANLKNLILKGCYGYKSESLSINHPLLSTLTIENSYSSYRSWRNFSVVAPQLKNLTIRSWWPNQYLISAPDLESLVYKGNYPLQLSTNGFRALEKADICVHNRIADAHGIVRMLEQLQSVKFLTLNLEILELLSSSVEVISNHPSPFANLKSLKIHPVDKLSQMNVKISIKVKNYLLDSSPNATVTMFSREDIRAMENTKLVQKQMKELRVLLERGRKLRPRPTEHQWR